MSTVLQERALAILINARNIRRCPPMREQTRHACHIAIAKLRAARATAV